MAALCTYCEEKVNATRGIYIKCATCQDISLCLECFSAGATIGEHESDHPYELIDCGSFPIIDEHWKAYEELALLEATGLYGIGSWTDIANAVQTRSAEECCERYIKVHVENFFGRSTWNAIDRDLYTVHDHTCAQDQPLSPSLSLPERHKIVDISREQQIRLGYMPKRDDFEREYDNDAELLVSKLAVNANDDTQLDQDLKIAHINMYTDKLRERFRRKRIVLEYNLVKLFFHMHHEENEDLLQDTSSTTTIPQAISDAASTTGFTPENSGQQTSSSSSEPKDAMPSISSCNMSHQDIKPKIEGQHDIVRDISEASSGKPDEKSSVQGQTTILNYFRPLEPPQTPTNGTNNRDSSTAPPESSILSSYFSNLNKSIAEQDFNTMEKRLRIFCQFSSVEEHNKLIRNLAREKELKVRIKELIKKRKNGLKYHNSIGLNGNESDVSSKQSSSAKKNSSKSVPSTTTTTPTATTTTTINNNNSIEEPMDVDETSTLSPTKVTQKKTNNKNESTKAIMNLHFNQNSEPSWRLLSESEKRLCKSSNLKPSQYISFKAFIIKEHTQKKKKGAAQRLFTDDIDKTVKKRIVNFLTRNNWIKV